eukprot:TRINITY_DN5317_c0_g2_i1.p1 TRINITY_DN5317_c0_g2~~TRINITY_DN5317_c0_g2_i1.p1  ORF type:complete len:538 (+),score=95.35 TRINITY_DN5317_c0_g2_i1:148-1761(+)
MMMASRASMLSLITMILAVTQAVKTIRTSAESETARGPAASVRTEEADNAVLLTHEMSLVGRSQQQSTAAMFSRLNKFCQDHFFLTLETCVQPMDDNTTYVVTGDIDAMWIRDSSAQLHPYIALAQAEEKKGRQSRLRPILEGALRRQAQFIRTDPYANAFTIKWDSARDDRLARGGYVFTGNYELDDGPYFFRFMSRLHEAFPSSTVIHEKPIQEATRTLLALYRQEQQHAFQRSEYRYPKSPPYELGGPNGQGQPVGYTGMVWGAFRPSDDAQTYGYNIPGNFFLAATLKKVSEIARITWKDQILADAAAKLRNEILAGIDRFGTHRRPNGELVYCYEVDGLGRCTIMDDANVPSLLSLPYLDPAGDTYNKSIYKATRKVILSKENPWFFEGSKARGIGSPHTGDSMVWPMSLVMQAMTAETPNEEASLLSFLEGPMMHKDGLTESFDVNEPSRITRPWFGWPNSLFGEHMISKRGCMPDFNQLDKKIPKMRRARRWDGGRSFYEMDPARMRRYGVTLPRAEFYPGHVATKPAPR